jgi:pyridoxal phosphate enzyme (YggS family)
LKDFGYIQDNLRRVSGAIALAAEKAHRPLPRMVAVTKSASPEEVLALVALGVSEIAENRTVLFRERWALFSDEERPVMHLIGSLQTNKVKEVVGNAALIQSVDRRSLAEEIQKRAAKAGICQGVLLEINSGREEAKGGILPEEADEFYASLSAFKSIRVRGLMTMAPRCNSREEYLKYFSLTKEIFDRLFKNEKDAILSMGMSESYLYAIEAGANMVRVGSAIFGERN